MKDQFAFLREDELAHYGVEGMKWGVRKAHTGQLEKPIARLNRVAEGKGSLYDKARVASDSSALRLVTSKGLKGEAARRAAKLEAHRDRLATGHATAMDILKAYGSVSIVSLARAAKKS